MGCCNSSTINWEEEEVWLGHFELGRAIGKGGFTRVKAVEYKRTGEQYALKFMHKSIIAKKKSAKSYIQERKILETIDHPYIVNLRWAFQDDHYLYYVLDLMLGGDLRFHHDRKWCPGEPAIKLWIAQIVLATTYLHSQRVIHRDLKLDNILLDSKGHAHITDFNCATWISSSHQHSQQAGTRRYMAPEMLKGTGYDWQIDYWAIGMIAYEMLFKDIPFGKSAKTENAMYNSIIEDEVVFPPNVDELCSREGQDFIRGLLRKDPSQRLACQSRRTSFAQIRDHPWFRGMDWEKLARKEIPSTFIPSADKMNFDISHELDEFLVIDKPLTQGRRRNKNRDLEKLKPQDRLMEEEFLPFDYTKSRRSSQMTQANARAQLLTHAAARVSAAHVAESRRNSNDYDPRNRAVSPTPTMVPRTTSVRYPAAASYSDVQSGAIAEEPTYIITPPDGVEMPPAAYHPISRPRTAEGRRTRPLPLDLSQLNAMNKRSSLQYPSSLSNGTSITLAQSRETLRKSSSKSSSLSSPR